MVLRIEGGKISSSDNEDESDNPDTSSAPTSGGTAMTSYVSVTRPQRSHGALHATTALPPPPAIAVTRGV